MLKRAVPLTSTPASPPFDLLANRFERLASLNDSERGVLRLIERRPTQLHRTGERLLTEGRGVRAPYVLLSGWAAHVRELRDGRRQIFGLVLPGDAVGMTPFRDTVSPANVVALTEVRTVEAAELNLAWRERTRVPNLAVAFDRAAAEDEFFLLAQIMRLGRQTAHERFANLLLELDYRLRGRGLGLGQNRGFALPLTQEVLADALGLSVVHVNRTLQQMRRSGLVEISRGRVVLKDVNALRNAGEFVEPPTLQLNKGAASA